MTLVNSYSKNMNFKLKLKSNGSESFLRYSTNDYTCHYDHDYIVRY